MRPSDYPIRWARGFGWGSWRGFFNLMFPRPEPMPGYTLLPTKLSPWWAWPYAKAKRLNWAIRGPL